MTLIKMMIESFYIKNMVCPRCIMAVKSILEELKIDYVSVNLGQIDLNQPLSKGDLNQLEIQLKNFGFEILEPGNSSLVSKIKTTLIEQIHYSTEYLNVNFSAFLSDKLNHEYSYLSRLFSSVEGITIEKYITKLRIEKVKELLYYNELSLTQIAYQLGYSSVAYLSTQFKKETGMTPTEFKKLRGPGHKHLDSL
ncbi:helix-turn-helix domain-containing protein [Cecembia rubra]|uniref:AraC family transcriptional regulator n=2 Tax=Cecembia rubra TaxID=1485585 RepID=A0A2P8DW75_9BACT|nr:helix-turn-helix domain-containing protein [Cecembia rubra]PSL01479.1 AraC family transcriptional regulator [Cecembia rubra]